MSGFKMFDNADELIHAVSDKDTWSIARLLEDANAAGGPCKIHGILKGISERDRFSNWLFHAPGESEPADLFSRDTPETALDTRGCKP
jgi:hypothetical protein